MTFYGANKQQIQSRQISPDKSLHPYKKAGSAKSPKTQALLLCVPVGNRVDCLESCADVLGAQKEKRILKKTIKKYKNAKKRLAFFKHLCYHTLAHPRMRHAPIAQLDRVTDYESVGRGFESLSAYQKYGIGFCLSHIFIFLVAGNSPRHTGHSGRLCLR